MINLFLILTIKIQTEFSKILLIPICRFHDKSFNLENQGSESLTFKKKFYYYELA